MGIVSNSYPQVSDDVENLSTPDVDREMWIGQLASSPLICTGKYIVGALATRAHFYTFAGGCPQFCPIYPRQVSIFALFDAWVQRQDAETIKRSRYPHDQG